MKKHYYFIGIGGVGMGAIAAILLKKGEKVSGSDIRENAGTQLLRKKGAQVFIGHNQKNLKEVDIVVYSSAIKETNCERNEAKERGCVIMSRAELLAQLMQGYESITVAGAHGKTTTTSMISNLLSDSGCESIAAVGGCINSSASQSQFKSFSKGLLLDNLLNCKKYFVAEVDESDGSLLHFYPQYSVITNIDLEHLDFYDGWDHIKQVYARFISQTKENGIVIACGDDENLRNLVEKSGCQHIFYGFSKNNIVQAQNIKNQKLTISFDCLIEGENVGRVILNVPGNHNILNALGCIALGWKIGLSFDLIKHALKVYTGVQRRFQVIKNDEDILIVDDYAHHPTEIKATLETAQGIKHPQGKLIAVFQPHRYSRLKELMNDFAQSLTNCDQIILTDVYAAGENPIEGATVQILREKIEKISSVQLCVLTKEKIVNQLSGRLNPYDIVITLGAGDINKVAYDLEKEICNKKVFQNSENVQRFGRIGVLMGGSSSERDISLKSGTAILDGLKIGGCNAVGMDISLQSDEAIENYVRCSLIDVAFIALHGKLGEDGRIQEILENLKIPYTGSGVDASRLTINKAVTQEFLLREGINVPKFFVIKKGLYLDVDKVTAQCGPFPLVVKPACEGSSIGVHIVSDEFELLWMVEENFKFGNYVLIEQFISGKEVTVSIVNEKALEVIEVRPKSQFFDFRAKYEKGTTEYVLPADLSEGVTKNLKETALRVHQILGCKDFSRVDFILGGDGNSFVLEINTIPGFTETSLLPKAAQNAGISFSQLCTTIVGFAYGKKEEK